MPPSGSAGAGSKASSDAPTPEQIRRMYEDEKALFVESAKAFLGGTSDSVQDLDHDEARKQLIIGTSGGTSIFSGLQRVVFNPSTVAANTNIKAVAQRGGILLLGTAAQAAVYQEAVVGKESVLDHARPRDAGGRYRALGVTTDATPLDLAPRVLIGKREEVMIEARILGRVYGAADSKTISYVRKATYYRDAGGGVTLKGAVQTIGTDTETTATADGTFQIDTASQTVSVRVTGAASKRIAWSANLTVTRYSEDQTYAA